jgi:hypothetical protein
MYQKSGQSRHIVTLLLRRTSNGVGNVARLIRVHWRASCPHSEKKTHAVSAILISCLSTTPGEQLAAYGATWDRFSCNAR